MRGIFAALIVLLCGLDAQAQAVDQNAIARAQERLQRVLMQLESMGQETISRALREEIHYTVATNTYLAFIGVTPDGATAAMGRSSNRGYYANNFELDTGVAGPDDWNVRSVPLTPNQDAFIDVDHLRPKIQTYPVVKLVVVPVPPRDYSIRINKREQSASEAASYRVPKGQVEVIVERAGKPPCVWKGPLLPGQVKTINCPL